MDLNTLTDQILAINNWVYQPILMPTILLIVGGLITVRTGWV